MTQRKYHALYKSGELRERAERLNRRLAECDICPRACRVNRLEGSGGYCRSGKPVRVASSCAHNGEEPAISGTRGSGTIFFGSCNLSCVYCQNYQISQGHVGLFERVDGRGLARIMIYLQEELRCHNINLVSPTHYAPQIVEAVCEAIPLGLDIPIVYNSNAYDCVETLAMLDGIIDIYLPDIKYASDKWAAKFSGAKKYVRHSRLAIAEMYRQVGNMVTDGEGVAVRGLIVRHLILPNRLSGSEDSLKWLATALSREVTLSLMAQYYPCHNAGNEPLLSRRINAGEYSEVVDIMEGLGMGNGWLQQLDSAEHYLPDFQREGHPFSR
ncbi:MAG: radical SAM protein [Chloroflexi bacterium]|nr:radical SAM protein [Chloroflexota bacterium]